MIGIGAGSLLGAGVSSLANVLMNHSTNKQNEELTRENWAREDTAVQRRTLDLKTAGINPLLAAGQAASSSAPIPMKAGTVEDFGGAFVSGKQAETQKKLQEQAKDIGLKTLENSTKVANAQVANLEASTAKAGAETLQALHDLAIFQNRGTTSRDSGVMNQIQVALDKIAGIFGKQGNNILKDGAKALGDALMPPLVRQTVPKMDRPPPAPPAKSPASGQIIGSGKAREKGSTTHRPNFGRERG